MQQTVSRKRIFGLFCCGVAIIGYGFAITPVGMAATDTNSSFVAHYEHRAQIEAELMSRTQSLAPAQDVDVINIQRAVAGLDQQIASLYTADQAFSPGVKAPMPPARIASGVRKVLRDAQSGVGMELKAYTDAVHHPGTRGKAWVKQVAPQVSEARTMAQNITMTTQTVNASIARPAFRASTTLQMDVLQVAVEQAQANLIELVNAWLWLADPQWPNAKPVAATDLAYSASTITIPTKSQQPVTDPVGVQPQVTDVTGQTLPDMGTYRLEGPLGHTGVLVDPLIGTVTVHPGATPGVYTVVYGQGSVNEHTVIEVISSGTPVS